MSAGSRSVALWIVATSISIGLLAAPLAAYAATSTIEIRDFSFQPRTLTVRVGDTVTWINRDTTAHTATAPGTFDTGSLGFGLQRSVAFTTPGTYQYFCLFHSIMFGTVVVLRSGDPVPTAAPPPATAPTNAPSAAPTPAAQTAATSASATATPAATAGAISLPAPRPPVAIQPPDASGPGSAIVAGAGMAVVALAGFAWLLARRT